MQIQQYAKLWKHTVVCLFMHKWPNWKLVCNRLNEQLKSLLRVQYDGGREGRNQTGIEK